MGDALKKELGEVNIVSISNLDETTSERIKKTHTEELVIAICSQIGAKKKLVIDKLKESLTEYGYSFKDLKLSTYIEQMGGEINVDVDPSNTAGFNNYISKIKKGNKLREKYGNDYLANLAISNIALEKTEKYNIEKKADLSKVVSQRKCYIIDSIKNTEELNALRDIYGDVLYLVSVFTPVNERVKNISIPNITQNEAQELIDIDQYEDSIDDNGQQVREVFVDADFFIKVDKQNESLISRKIKRFTNLIFENELVTPTSIERAMYEAQSAAVNSACLSRQVGASILSCDSELLSIGWNDVPKFGGNLYSSESEPDNRCYAKGKCYNDYNKGVIKKVIKDTFQSEFGKIDFYNKQEDSTGERNLDIKGKVFNLLDDILNKSSIKSLIEFSRSVHAEMHAILNAGQLNGGKIRGSSLFCTTYPCHNCVRHIIAAGITKVYYIEPYVKSKGIDLHSDSISDEEKRKKDKVQILMFEGVSPKRYGSFFLKTRSRKEKVIGKSKCENRNKIELYPKNSISLQALIYRELLASERIDEKKSLIDETEKEQGT